MRLAYWNGTLTGASEVWIDPADPGFLFGDGLFETLRVDDGRARDVGAHLDRLLAGLRRLRVNIPEDGETLEKAVTDVARMAPRPIARLRITVTPGTGGMPTRLITAAAWEPPSEDLYHRGVAVLLLPQYRIDSRSPLAGLKTLCYQANRLALHHAERLGAWEALLVNENGRLVEGSRSNVALVFPDGVLTPPRSDGCLAGTVRRRLLERGAVAERPLAPEDLATAGEVLLLNSLIGVLPVSQIDGRALPVGPTAGRLRGMFEEMV
ncbi:MAG TPA: aminotransferase class IV [Thermoanaerobaculia bacterium]|nr:aminotransferase class IV [Thermoanaerobaculia bacterium]